MSAPFFMSLLVVAAPVFAGGGWVSFDREDHCAAVAKPVRATADQSPQPFVTIIFDRDGPRRGHVTFRFERKARPGSQAMLTVGRRPFLLATRGPNAWSRDPKQADAIIEAIRSSGSMRLVARDGAGRQMASRYMLSGAPAAIDAAAACAARR